MDLVSIYEQKQVALCFFLYESGADKAFVNSAICKKYVAN